MRYLVTIQRNSGGSHGKENNPCSKQFSVSELASLPEMFVRYGEVSDTPLMMYYKLENSGVPLFCGTDWSCVEDTFEGEGPFKSVSVGSNPAGYFMLKAGTKLKDEGVLIPGITGPTPSFGFEMGRNALNDANSPMRPPMPPSSDELDHLLGHVLAAGIYEP